MQIDQIVLDKILPLVQKPARYMGGELNSIVKSWIQPTTDINASSQLTVALAFPDSYEIGMSNLALQTIYGLLNEQEDIICERVFAPWPDLDSLLRNHDIPLFSLESKHPLGDFDAIGFALSYELSYTNVLNMLDLANIPLASKDRNDTHPLIFAGGHAALNPEPMSEFIDFFIIGEAEEVLLEVTSIIKKLKSKTSRDQLFKALSEIEGVYIPKLGNITKRRIIKDFDSCYVNLKPIVPYIDTIHNRATLEIMRGCPRRCKFCQAGYITLPKRERTVETLKEQARQILNNTGYEEIGLLSLSACDHSNINTLVKEMHTICKKKKISLSLPSLRMDDLDPDVISIVQETSRSSITLAPEAGTQRLRDVIHKNITEVDIIRGMEIAKASGAKTAKLYFMIGLPTETEADLQGIVDLAYKLRSFLPLTISASTFIPKPHTPFQWEQQISMEHTIARQEFLKQKLKGKRLKFRWHNARSSVLEGVLSRGGSQLGQVIKTAWEQGCRFDGWDEHFKWDIWEPIIQPYIQVITESKKSLPWQNIDIGLSEDRLRKERVSETTQV